MEQATTTSRPTNVAAAAAGDVPQQQPEQPNDHHFKLPAPTSFAVHPYPSSNSSMFSLRSSTNTTASLANLALGGGGGEETTTTTTTSWSDTPPSPPSSSQQRAAQQLPQQPQSHESILHKRGSGSHHSTSSGGGGAGVAGGGGGGVRMRQPQPTMMKSRREEERHPDQDDTADLNDDTAEGEDHQVYVTDNDHDFDDDDEHVDNEQGRLPPTNAASRRPQGSAQPTKSALRRGNSQNNKKNNNQKGGNRSAAALAREDQDDGFSSNNNNNFWCWAIFGVWLALVLGTSGTVLGIYNLVRDNTNDGDDDNGCGAACNANSVSMNDENSTNHWNVNSTLYAILNRGYLNCGVGPQGAPGFLWENPDNGQMVGMELDLCIALASALFQGELDMPNNNNNGNGMNEKRYRLIPIPPEQRWQLLLQHPNYTEGIDLLFRSTHTMERDVYEPTTRQGFAFSSPYVWENLVLGGTADHVACAEALDFTSVPNCAATVICVTQGTTHERILSQTFGIPADHLVSIPDDSVNGFLQKTTTGETAANTQSCNVVAGERGFINPLSLQARGYNIADYTLGTRLFSKEPIALVTRQGDPTWSDFVEWTLQALIYAEEQAITKTSAKSLLGATTVFDTNTTDRNSPLAAANGTALSGMFQNAVAARGNYGEIYNFNLESFMPRAGLNSLNLGDSPIMYAFPFGSLMQDDPNINVPPELEVQSPTVRAIKARGFLNCGISSRMGFANFDRVNKTWSGFDVDLCRALSAALFDGVDTRVVFTDLPAAQRFPVLVQQRVDVLARLTTLTLSRDVQEPQTAVGLSFAAPYVYDGLTFGGVPPFDTCADDLDVVSPECQALNVCLLQGTTILSRVQDLLRDEYVTAKLTFTEVVDGLNDGSCNAIAGGFHDVAVQTIREQGYQGNYSVGEKRHSKDPLALTTTQADPYWSDFVRWIFWGLVYAEEQNITQATAFSDMPRTTLFGPLRTDAFYLAVNAVGNYGEMFERNFGALIPRNGMHLLNLDDGPMFYAMPGILRN
ncbi:hypothetical protein ACA910_001965 [Epithemia clementina (nom. ined.)]